MISFGCDLDPKGNKDAMQIHSKGVGLAIERQQFFAIKFHPVLWFESTSYPEVFSLSTSQFQMFRNINIKATPSFSRQNLPSFFQVMKMFRRILPHVQSPWQVREFMAIYPKIFSSKIQPKIAQVTQIHPIFIWLRSSCFGAPHADAIEAYSAGNIWRLSPWEGWERLKNTVVMGPPKCRILCICSWLYRSYPITTGVIL